MVNSLRMRPDRVIVGEIRRKEEAEVLFEAMHTGHSVYSTLHADNTEQMVSRLINPPIGIPKSMLDSIGGVVVAFRHRRFNIRRVIEFSEVYNNGTYSTIYQWDAKTDKIKKTNELNKIAKLLQMYVGITPAEIDAEIKDRSTILKWMEKKRYFDVEVVGKIVSTYYTDPDGILNLANKNADFKI